MARRLWRWATRVAHLDVCDPGELAELRDRVVILTGQRNRYADQTLRLIKDRNRALARAERAEAALDQIIAG